MKTAISIPDSTFQRAEAKAAELGMSRSQFYATAAERFMESLENDSMTAAINAAVEIIGETDESNQAAVAASRQAVARNRW
ncbi:MAG: CopG family transcriptional regulator [Actinobacteria bacterium]|nr:CopG family transcriptional regulator [Actinomycetota bacterium]